MKKPFLSLLIFIVFSVFGYSQIEKKTILLGGYGNFILSTANNSYFSLNPNSGLFLSDNFCLGLSLPIMYVSENFYWGLTPFARYYLKEKDNNSIFLSGSIGLTSLLENENTISSGLISVGVGHVWFLNKSTGFETVINGGTSNFREFTIGLHFGFQIYFNRQNKE